MKEGRLWWTWKCVSREWKPMGRGSGGLGIPIRLDVPEQRRRAHEFIPSMDLSGALCSDWGVFVCLGRIMSWGGVSTITPEDLHLQRIIFKAGKDIRSQRSALLLILFLLLLVRFLEKMKELGPCQLLCYEKFWFIFVVETFWESLVSASPPPTPIKTSVRLDTPLLSFGALAECSSIFCPNISLGNMFSKFR